MVEFPQMDPGIKIKLKLNQNLWGLIVAYVALGIAQHRELKYLSMLAMVLSAVMTLSLIVTTIAYTGRYWRSKKRPLT